MQSLSSEWKESRVSRQPSLQAVQADQRPGTPQARILEAVRAAEELLEPSTSPITERTTEIHLSGQRSHTGSAVNLANASLVETPPVECEVEVESTYVNVIPATSTPKAPVVEEKAQSPLPPSQDVDELLSNLNETPQRKRTLPSRPTIAPKPSVSGRATSEPPAGIPAHMVLSGGEPVSLPHQPAQAQDSPMPELLSLKDRLRLFEKEIDDQQKVPEPKKDRKFSFLSDDEVVKMKEEEARRIASMTAMDLEAFDSLTSHLSVEEDEQTVRTQLDQLDRYDCTEAAAKEAEDEVDETEPSDHLTEAERKAAWRKARLDSLEDDAMQAQIVIEKMSELSTADTQLARPGILFS